MTTVSELKKYVLSAPKSGISQIDGLLNSNNAWCFLLTAASNTLYYSFSIAAGTEADVTGLTEFNNMQEAAVRQILEYVSRITGIEFQETAEGDTADIHFAGKNIAGSEDAGSSRISMQYGYDGAGTVTTLVADAYVYLDNAEYRTQNLDPAAGTFAYHVLLHELGHVLGLKHPFANTADASVVLDAALDNTTNTLMSYNITDGYQTTFSPYDLAALDYLYGGDGLGGINYKLSTSATYFSMASTLTGSDKSDRLAGFGGNDQLYGYAGNDKLDGAGGDDWLNGSSGMDKLSGGSGADTFFFDYPDGGADKVTDFNVSEGDSLVFSPAVFTALGDEIGPDNVVIARKAVALDADDYVLLSTQGGKLYFDPDGNGDYVPILLAALKGSLSGIDYTCFIVDGT